MTFTKHVVLLLALIFLLGCAGRENRLGITPGNHNEPLTVAGLERSYILHVPSVSRAARRDPLPLIIVLHGTWGNGRKMEIGLGFDAYADERGFYVAYPDAYQPSDSRQTARWNDGRDTLASSNLGIDDVAFILSLIDDIAAKVPLATDRVYVTGASNGGIMAYRLGCETSGVFAGIAPVIGNVASPIAQACTPQAPLSLLAINGDADPFIPFAGGEVCPEVRLGCEKGFVISTADSVAKFAVANGCDLTPQSESLPVRVDDGTHVERLRYANCSGAAEVVSYIVRGGGHTWPPRDPQVTSGGQATGNLDATETIVNFFIP